ncbi:MAG: hypothetical protein V4616_04375 [Bacteroidota bacterium]
MKKLLPIFTLLLLQISLFAQDKAFTVMALQGKATANGKPVSIGQQLNADASLVLNDAAYVGLLHKGGNSLEFKTKGTYPLKPFNEKLSSSSKGFQQKYMDYVVTGMTKKSGGSSYQKNMGITGSVDRALAKNDIIVPLPSKVTLINSKMSVDWMDETQDGKYQVIVKNMKEEPIFQVGVASKSATLDLSSLNLEPEQYYLLTIYAADGDRKSNTVGFYVPTIEEKTALITDFESVNSALDLETSIGLMAYAQFCEQKGLYLDAYQAYKKARQLSPDVAYFDTVYKEFVDDVVAKM